MALPMPLPPPVIIAVLFLNYIYQGYSHLPFIFVSFEKQPRLPQSGRNDNMKIRNKGAWRKELVIVWIGGAVILLIFLSIV
jgi:hypothetical protein